MPLSLSRSHTHSDHFKLQPFLLPRAPMASSATLTNRLLRSPTARSFCSKVYYIVRPIAQRAREDARDDLHRCGLLIQDEDDALYLQKSMPGLGIDDVNVWIDPKNGALRVKGEPGGYEMMLHLPPFCRPEEKTFKMENGLLRVIVPKDKPTGEGPTRQAQWAGKPEHYKPGEPVVIVGYQRQDE